MFVYAHLVWQLFPMCQCGFGCEWPPARPHRPHRSRGSGQNRRLNANSEKAKPAPPRRPRVFESSASGNELRIEFAGAPTRPARAPVAHPMGQQDTFGPRREMRLTFRYGGAGAVGARAPAKSAPRRQRCHRRRQFISGRSQCLVNLSSCFASLSPSPVARLVRLLHLVVCSVGCRRRSQLLLGGRATRGRANQLVS